MLLHLERIWPSAQLLLFINYLTFYKLENSVIYRGLLATEWRRRLFFQPWGTKKKKKTLRLAKNVHQLQRPEWASFFNLHILCTKRRHRGASYAPELHALMPTVNVCLASVSPLPLRLRLERIPLPLTGAHFSQVHNGGGHIHLRINYWDCNCKSDTRCNHSN